MTKYLVAVALVAACGGGAPGDDASDVTPDGRATPDGVIIDPDAPPGCQRPAINAAWVHDYVQSAVANLAQAPRYTDSERATARAYLRDQLMQLGFTPERDPFNTGENVVATLAATEETDDPIIVGAHFDTVQFSPGADDNASGSAMVLAVARYAAQVTCRKATVTFVWFDEEEEGLFGSRAYAHAHNPADYRAVHTYDEVAWNSDGDNVLELEQPTPALEAEWMAAAPLAGIELRVTGSGSTDHVSFRNDGYAAVGLSEEYVGGDTTPNYHLPSDTPDTLDYDLLAKAANLAAQVVMLEITR